MSLRDKVVTILGLSPAKNAFKESGEIADAFANGLQEGIKETNSEVEKIISNKFEGLSDGLTRIIESTLNRGD
ncbi:hypothetical protein G8B49_01810 [Enterococcus mundtii]|uniref:hypothetical protein n=1 Tax=Enterococcus mundtii TaxID=53346 RepID=UPI0018833D35|nr:hypothetical protein [Enterococcus mundtii]MBE9909996.1 hypothetical protein [Enterococcus mundtii]